MRLNSPGTITAADVDPKSEVSFVVMFLQDFTPTSEAFLHLRVRDEALHAEVGGYGAFLHAALAFVEGARAVQAEVDGALRSMSVRGATDAR